MNEQNENIKTSDKQNTQIMAILAYIGPLVIIPYLTSRGNPFVKFHIKQGLVLICIEVIIWLIAPMFMWQMSSLIQLLNLATLVLSIIGVVNVVQKKEKMLPIVGGLSSYFKF